MTLKLFDDKLNVARTWLKLDMPSTKQMESSTFDLPVPLRPVMALNSGSNPITSVRFP